MLPPAVPFERETFVQSPRSKFYSKHGCSFSMVNGRFLGVFGIGVKNLEPPSTARCGQLLPASVGRCICHPLATAPLSCGGR